MPDGKQRILCIREYLEQNTDPKHPVTTAELLACLAAFGFSSDRRTLYRDIRLLREHGLDVRACRGKTYGYYVASRAFELPELKLLVDAVQASRFIPEQKSRLLIQKLANLTSRAQARSLERYVFVQGRAKTENEGGFQSVDRIHEAIQTQKQIAFCYCQYSIDRDLKPRRDGRIYEVNPYLLLWSDDNYYLLADHPEHPGIVHFRVDKMREVRVLAQPRVLRYALPDPADYAKKQFSMFAGESETVEIRFDAALIGVVIDRFGRDVMIVCRDDAGFTIRTEVAVSPAFFAFLVQFGDKAQLLSPKNAVSAMRELLQHALRQQHARP